MKKLIFAVMLMLSGVAHAGQMVNVEYVHKMVESRWGIVVPYNPALGDVHVAANMEYVLTVVDRANQMLNGKITTNYGVGDYATRRAADIDATQYAVENLINKEFMFFVTTAPGASSFYFYLSAAGKFIVDWGDGTVQEITRTDTVYTRYEHIYTSAGQYKVGFGGRATGYAAPPSNIETEIPVAAIAFNDLDVEKERTDIIAIDGSLGQIFGTLPDGSQPMFVYTFLGCSGLTSIPENLFAGISGAPADYMFFGTFYGCRGLTGSIPENLFAGISGAPARGMFVFTFYGCSGLTGSIPENLFAGIRGAPAIGMFALTFMECSGLTGSIPEKLFAGISGAPAYFMFGGTFALCSGLTGSIPEKLFAGISGAPASEMFESTFSGCSGLTGAIPENLFAGISGVPAERMFWDTFNGCSGLTGSIPENLFAGISGAPAREMFESTFSGCSGLTGAIPEKLFAGISGVPAERMFWGTFRDCSGLTSIPENLFGQISGAPAEWMFYYTFSGCSGLTGPSARINGQYLYEIWPSASSDQVGLMYRGATGLSDYADIPSAWK